MNDPHANVTHNVTDPKGGGSDDPRPLDNPMDHDMMDVDDDPWRGLESALPKADPHAEYIQMAVRLNRSARDAYTDDEELQPQVDYVHIVQEMLELDTVEQGPNTSDQGGPSSRKITDPTWLHPEIIVLAEPMHPRMFEKLSSLRASSAPRQARTLKTIKLTYQPESTFKQEGIAA